MYWNLAILALFLFSYSVVAGWVEREPLTGPIVYTLFGLALGPIGLGVLEFETDKETLRTLAELTLALVLFTDAATADLRVLRYSLNIPQRLLIIGLPLTILSGFLLGVLMFPDLGLLEIAILATMLAPTDAALGAAVVTKPAVPAEIRQGLNVESGLNDGICVPILFILLAVHADSSEAGGTLALAFRLFLEEIGIGVAVGLGLAALGTFVLRFCAIRGWLIEAWYQLPGLGLAIGAFSLAQALGGSGFIAAFAGGLLFGALAKQHTHLLVLAAEETGNVLALLTWVLFGSAVVGHAIGLFSWTQVLYAVLSLTLLRMLPVYLSLTGTGLAPGTKLFIGWFGPRGLASIVFAIIVLGADLPHGRILAMVVVCTVILSIFAHGLTANPLAKIFARRA